jgi:hypothetical protein
MSHDFCAVRQTIAHPLTKVNHAVRLQRYSCAVLVKGINLTGIAYQKMNKQTEKVVESLGIYRIFGS